MAALGGFTGFNFGAKPAATTTTSGFSFGGPSNTAAGASGGFGFGTSAATSSGQGGFSFGTTPSTGTLTLGLSTATTKPSLGFGLGSTMTQPSTGLFGTTNTASTTAGNFVLGGTSLSTGTTTASSTGITLGGLGTSTTSSIPQSGFGFSVGAKPFGLTGTTTLGSGLGTGLSGTTGTGSIFGSTVSKTTASGLGGVDHTTSTSTAGYNSSGTKLVNGKAVKETNIPQDLTVDVENFQKFVKEEKMEMENIKRMSATPMHKVQEDTAALRQLLSVVSNSVQRNALAVEKLKKKMTQELKSAEMAQRTKDIPASLQYENTAPTEYFQNLVEDFESQMLNYRQQIEVMESHLASLNQPNKFTPEEMIMLLKKMNETFVALAAQLHQVHDAVKTQKEHFLNYRKIFHGDTKNIFEKQKRTTVMKASPHHTTDNLGPSPFPGVTNAVAVAMATAMNRTQQHQGGRPPATGFAGGSGAGSGLLSSVPVTTTLGFSGFGTTSTQSSGFKGFGTGTSGLFGSNNNSIGGSVFGSKASQPSSAGFTFSSPTPATGVALPQQNLSASTEQPFQLNKPPLGTKRGKR
ncbi:hypothetical protein CHS0354_007500 [Potamilus streckersoni]|uniref:Nucleoporin p58/p45 n=1 Tax=Potamilus streckersoni TaxID=2493646 RepID=A0AAE0T8R5_9BIVA|nr:hypothetical protein CHS0354_007500 [Potamilus streckersoni]